MNNKELFTSLKLLEKEKGIPMDYMLEQIERAIKVACKNSYGGNENVVFKTNPDKNTFDVKLTKTVVEEVEDPNFEISLEEVRKKRKKIATKETDAFLSECETYRYSFNTLEYATL